MGTTALGLIRLQPYGRARITRSVAFFQIIFKPGLENSLYQRCLLLMKKLASLVVVVFVGAAATKSWLAKRQLLI